jgi:hypothetical protein
VETSLNKLLLHLRQELGRGQKLLGSERDPGRKDCLEFDAGHLSKRWKRTRGDTKSQRSQIGRLGTEGCRCMVSANREPSGFPVAYLD